MLKSNHIFTKSCFHSKDKLFILVYQRILRNTMTRQLKISEDVHMMLSLLKPFSSTSYDEVIRDLIEKACPYLPHELERISQLKQEESSEWDEQLNKLQNDLFENYYVEGLLRKRKEQKEREKEEAVDQYLEEKEREEEEAIDRQIEGQEKLQEQSRTPASKKAGGIPNKRSVKK